MKKTILALAVTSIFSVQAFAAAPTNDDVNASDVFKNFKVVTDADGFDTVVTRDGQTYIGDIESGETTTRIYDRDLNMVEIDNATGEYTTTNSDNVIVHNGKIIDNSVAPDNSKGPSDRTQTKKLTDAAKYLASNGSLSKDGSTITLDKGDYAGHKVDLNTGKVTKDGKEVANITIDGIEEGRHIRVNEVKTPNTDGKNNDAAYRPEDRSNGQDSHIKERYVAMADGMDEALAHAVNGNHAVEVDGVKYTNEQVRDAANYFADMSKEERAAAMAMIENQVEHGDIKDVKIVDGASNDDSNNNDIIAIDGEVNARIAEAGKQVYKDADTYVTTTNTKLADHEKRIGTLEQDMKKMGNKMLVLEDRMDGVVASAHAITNARPVLSQAGQFGMGVGVGAAGSKQAIALGGAYQISESWSGTMSVNYETKGKVSEHQLSAGVGAQYIF
ncbi:YadA-like family protein [Vibrio kyushuensis]|uniref:YadA-like family protein n=1 Tax=Vibrio kyushuensis TaxID=2910249 RepID=UPI003D1102D6